jgi:hypothetical protein
MGPKRNVCRIFVGKPEGKRPLRVIVLGGMEWIDMVPDRDWWRALVYTVMNFRVQ